MLDQKVNDDSSVDTLQKTPKEYFKRIQFNMDCNNEYSQFVILYSSIEAAEEFVHQFPGAMIYGCTDSGLSTLQARVDAAHKVHDRVHVFSFAMCDVELKERYLSQLYRIGKCMWDPKHLNRKATFIYISEKEYSGFKREDPAAVEAINSYNPMSLITV
jgi:hypothetical protein